METYFREISWENLKGVLNQFPCDLLHLDKKCEVGFGSSGCYRGCQLLVLPRFPLWWVQSPLLWASKILGQMPVVGCQPRCWPAAPRKRSVYICQPSFFPGWKVIREKSGWIEQLKKPPEPRRGKQGMPFRLALLQRIKLQAMVHMKGDAVKETCPNLSFSRPVTWVWLSYSFCPVYTHR